MALNRIKESAFIFAVICFAISVYSFASHTASADEPADIAIVANGQGQAVVVVPQRFDSEIKGWTPPGTTTAGKVSVVADKKHSGNYSLHIKDEDNRNYGAESNLVAINGGESYTASAKVYVASGANPAIMIYYYNSSKQLIAYPYAVGGTAGQWTDLSVTGVAPANASYASVVLFSDTSGLRSVYFDDVMLKNAANASLPLSNPGFEDISNIAADTLVEYIGKASGATLQILTEAKLLHEEASYQAYSRIYIGGSIPTGDAQLDTALAGLPDDGFVIQGKDNKITIIGPGDLGTEFGVYEFLERYVGVRWLMPGPDGEYVPSRATLAIAEELVREEPAAISRHFFGMDHPPESAVWARHNRMNDNIQFHHNLENLFDPAVFSNHPEYYPGGVVPQPGTWDWNPCLNSQTAAAAITRIKQYFQQNPDKSSYSLGVTDSRVHCESDPNHPNYPGANHLNSIGLLNMSDLYYPWVNQIVEGVLADPAYADKYFGLLAYAQVYDPPKNANGTPYLLHPHVIPYITDDRLTWLDPDLDAEAQAHMQQWQLSSQNFGFYEYLYGSPYQIPRMYPHKMADNYQYAEEHGVIAHVAELYPNFGEGPKPWISTKLQWNPDLDVDMLLDEWYTAAAGEAAAPVLQEYFEHWEQFWTSRVFASDWYTSWKQSVPRKNYLNLYAHGYLNLITKAELDDSRELLETALDLTETADQHARVQSLLKSFDYYEASALSYPRSGAVAPPTNETEALAMFADFRLSLEMGEKRIQLYEAYRDEPMHAILPNQTQYIEAWDGLQPNLETALLSYAAANENENGTIHRAYYELMLDFPTVFKRTLVVKYEQPKAVIVVPQRFDSEIKGWTPPGTTVAGKVSVVANKKHSGNYSLHIKDEDNRNYGAESSLVAINGGESYTASAMAYVESGANPAIMIYYYDSSKQLIAYPYAVGGTVGQWTALSVTGVAPANAAYASVVLFSDTSGIRSLYFDDVVLKNSSHVSLPLSNPGFEDISDSAADMLAEYIRRSTTVELPVIAETKLRAENELYDDVTRIYVGGRVPTGDAELDQMLAGLINDEFVIQIKDKKIAIIGAASTGTGLGVKEYLKIYVGVIWPAPGISEYVPELSSILSPWTTVN